MKPEAPKAIFRETSNVGMSQAGIDRNFSIDFPGTEKRRPSRNRMSPPPQFKYL
jgi:hypothetical protein